MTAFQDNKSKIGSDAPQTDPAFDAFGYAPFARRIAEAVRNIQSPHGLVMAVHGPWGAGKTSLLNFIKHYLKNLTETEQPIMIDFNPWWFSSREHLASQFLSQFRSKLIKESALLRKAGDTMAEYSDTIGKAVSLSYGIPWLDNLIGPILKLLRRKQKEVPELKLEIAEALKNQKKRIIFFIDDIDRLAPDEIRELFKVIKALADFPNVIYLLSFDRKIVADALQASLGVEGEAFLEKIVQAPFVLPAVDHLHLQKKLFAELNEILEIGPVPNFNQTYWGNVYLDGLDQYVKKPRDIVRIVNVLSVTYSAVAGEVNPVDFIALEFLRVFEPEVYGTIRDNKDMFTGASDSSYQRNNEPEKTFHKSWLDNLPPEHHDNVKRLIVRLFPKLSNVLGNSVSYGSSWSSNWRRDLRVCASEVFDIYFQFGVSTDVLSRAELDALVAAACEPEKIKEILEAAASIRRPDGTSKAREILGRLQDLTDELSPEVASGLLSALFTLGDRLLSDEDEQGFCGIPNKWRLLWAVNYLLKRIPDRKEQLLLTLIVQGEALALIIFILDIMDDYASKQEVTDSALAEFDVGFSNELKKVVVDRLEGLDIRQLLEMKDFSYIIHRWSDWTSKEVVVEAIRPLLLSDDLLPTVLEKYISFSTGYGEGDRVTRRMPHLNPKNLEPLIDIAALELRVQQLLSRTDLTESQRTAVELFLKGMTCIREGKDPDRYFS